MTSHGESTGVEHYCLFEAAIGTCGVAWTAQGLTRLNLPEVDRAAVEARLRRRAAPAGDVLPFRVSQAIDAIKRYCVGERTDFASLALDMTRVAAFDRGVYAAARAIPWGHTTTYGELARRIGFPDAARSVGQALGRNPLPIIVPCHRVLAKAGMGGFSAPGGVSAKARLLALEGIVSERQMVLGFMDL